MSDTALVHGIQIVKAIQVDRDTVSYHSLGQGQAGAFPLSVDFVEALGADTLAHGYLDNGRVQLTVRLPGSTRVAAGDALSLVVPTESLHLFDASTGARL